MNKTILFLIIFFSLSSCSKSINVHKNIYFHARHYETVFDDAIIAGHHLHDFFKDSEALKIYSYEVVGGNKAHTEWKAILNGLAKSNIQHSDMGIYYYAIIYQNDTLYTSSFKSWSNGEKMCHAPSNSLKRMLKNTSISSDDAGESSKD